MSDTQPPGSHFPELIDLPLEQRSSLLTKLTKTEVLSAIGQQCLSTGVAANEVVTKLKKNNDAKIIDLRDRRKQRGKGPKGVERRDRKSQQNSKLTLSPLTETVTRIEGAEGIQRSHGYLKDEQNSGERYNRTEVTKLFIMYQRNLGPLLSIQEVVKKLLLLKKNPEETFSLKDVALIIFRMHPTNLPHGLIGLDKKYQEVVNYLNTGEALLSKLTSLVTYCVSATTKI